MSSDQQLQVQSSQLNIPPASSLVQSQGDQKVTIFKEQAQLIEEAFGKATLDEQKICVELDKPLSSDLWNQLGEKGYNISQSMRYDSRNPETHNGKYKVTITPQSETPENYNQMLKEIRSEMNNRFLFSPLTHPRFITPLLW